MLDVALHLRTYGIFEYTRKIEVLKQNAIELIAGLAFLVFTVILLL